MRRSTPRCQSFELVNVTAGMFCTTLVSGSPPVDVQRPTVWAVWNRNKDRKETYVYIVCKVEPCVCGEGGTPFLNTTDHPYKVCRRRTDTVFQLTELFIRFATGNRRTTNLCEMVFEEGDLMFQCRLCSKTTLVVPLFHRHLWYTHIRRIQIRPLDRKMIKQISCT